MPFHAFVVPELPPASRQRKLPYSWIGSSKTHVRAVSRFSGHGLRALKEKRNSRGDSWHGENTPTYDTDVQVDDKVNNQYQTVPQMQPLLDVRLIWD